MNHGLMEALTTLKDIAPTFASALGRGAGTVLRHRPLAADHPAYRPAR